MPLRVPDINSNIYTDVSPENIVSARKGAWFFRKNKTFYFNASGNINSEWITLPHRTVVLPAPNPSKLIFYRTPCELWEKSIDGYYDEFEMLKPKTGWTFKSYDDVFLQKLSTTATRSLRLVFPSPASSYDPTGTNGDKSYDTNYFYAKIGGIWYRAPICFYTFSGSYSAENPDRYSDPPYCANPRFLPVPPYSGYTDSAVAGEQTYDLDFFYIKPSNWKRTNINTFDAETMTMF